MRMRLSLFYPPPVSFHALPVVANGGARRACRAEVASKMGVKLEVFRMILYLSFPVSMFWISNQAEYFEEYVVKRKREIYPPELNEQKAELEEFKERMRKKREERLQRQLGSLKEP
ncbi:protein PET100 homolog, mitochondrial [Rhinatrema bivittatum]|uniref:protein PET100 homolog, mitochondrial n=1 Tax=Rhinatrema bivittatum TaxID=194408 RepID=UPI00112C06F9|nr:protein PET100 homolog, mitochondrial [Rhinatrema bivittatum]